MNENEISTLEVNTRRSSRSSKPREYYNDSDFIGSYARKGKLLQEKYEAKALEAKVQAKLKVSVKKTVKEKPKAKRKIASVKSKGKSKTKGKVKRGVKGKKSRDSALEEESFPDDNFPENDEDSVKQSIKKKTMYKRKPPRDKYDHTILMDMWSSAISEISAHKLDATDGSPLTCTVDENSGILTGNPLWSGLWVPSATASAMENVSVEELPVDHLSEQDDKTESNISSRRSRQALMQSNRTRATESSLQDDLAVSWADPHVLVTPYTYGKLPAHVSEAASMEQPFTVHVHPQVTFVSDLHAHLCDAEVIGLLAGKWDPSSRCLYIQSSFPCFSTIRVEDDGSTDVEMDPSAEIATREAIHRLGLQVVGWYHSHPTFRPDPSTTDIINQHSYQQLFRDSETNIEPFVGLIVSTFDPRRLPVESLHQWFHAVPFSCPSKSKKYDNMFLPMKIEVLQMTVIGDMSPIQAKCSPESMLEMEQNLLALKEECGDDAAESTHEVDSVSLEETSQSISEKRPKITKKPKKIRASRNKKSTNYSSFDIESQDDVVIDVPHVSSRGRARKRRRHYDDDDIDDANYAYSTAASLASFAGSGGETYALQAHNQVETEVEKAYPNSDPNVTAAAGRRSSRTTLGVGRFQDYYDENNAAVKSMLRQRVGKQKRVKPRGSAMSKVIPTTSVRYSIKSSRTNQGKKSITSAPKEFSDPADQKVNKKRNFKKRKTTNYENGIDIPTTTENKLITEDPPAPRYISLITVLQKEKELASMARSLVCSATPILQCSILSIVTICLYYSLHSRRTTLWKPWRKKTRLDKIRSSVSVWLKFFGMCKEDEEKILDEIAEFITLCWQDGSRNRK